MVTGEVAGLKSEEFVMARMLDEEGCRDKMADRLLRSYMQV